MLHSALSTPMKTTPVQYFMDLCLREAERQGIPLGFKRPRRT